MLTRTWTTMAAALLLAACSGDKGADGVDSTAGGGAIAEQPADQPAATGKVITVEMITDETGNYYKPKDIEAHPGDVVRFTLTSGVHNVHFVADSNAGVTGLPAASDLLQLPGQTYDFVVPAAQDDKKLYFQCDPHAALGMIGYIEIDKD
jgi:plastocyanin